MLGLTSNRKPSITLKINIGNNMNFFIGIIILRLIMQAIGFDRQPSKSLGCRDVDIAISIFHIARRLCRHNICPMWNFHDKTFFNAPYIRINPALVTNTKMIYISP